MKEKFRKKYLLLIFKDCQLDQLSDVRKGNMSVIKYMHKFDKLLCDVIFKKMAIKLFHNFALDSNSQLQDIFAHVFQ